MKKYLIVLAVMAIAFASCKKDEGNKYTSIKFKETEISIAQGASQKLEVLYEPTTLPAPVCAWKSSDTTIVKVDESGNIEAWEIGEANITATVGDLEAVCKVTVLDPLDMIEWGGWSIWKLNKDDLQSPDTFDLTISVGDVRCIVITANFRIWDNGFVQTTDKDGNFNGIDGAGYTMYIENVPVYQIVEPDQYKGAWISYGALWIVDSEDYDPADTTFICCAPAGRRYDAEKFYTYLTDTAAHIDYSECFSGVEIDYIDFAAQKGYGWQGLADKSIFAGDEWQAYYKSNVNWMDGIYGMEFDEKEEDYVKKPVEWAELIPKYYELLPPADEEEVRGIGEPKVFVEKHMPEIQIVRGTSKDVLMHSK